jgi:hypothetical protein
MNMVPSPASQDDSVAFESKAFKLLGEFERASSQIMERSVAHARQRCATLVLPEDVQAALQEALGSLHAAFVAAFSGNLNDFEFTDADFEQLNRLPFNRKDTINDADDEL